MYLRKHHLWLALALLLALAWYLPTRNTTLRAAPRLDLPPLQNIQQIGTGFGHTCAVTTAGGVQCWGSNDSGELGNNSLTASNKPVDVSGLSSDVSTVSAGFGHTCALTTAGGVQCWGNNDTGQLGIGSPASNSSVPAAVSGLDSGVRAVSTGTFHTCALTTAGGVKCWGYNNAGQLGNNSTVDSRVPVDVSGLRSGVSAISAGGVHTCAVTTAGAVKCWGANDEGQLGNNSTTSSSVPVNVSGLRSGVNAISTGELHTCAVTTAGAVKCWGTNDEGQLGNNSTTNSSVPVDVSNLSSGVSVINAGFGHTCALTTAGGVKCWGYNDSGQLGDGSNASRSVPVDVSGLSSGVSAISAGDGHTCVVTTVGGVKCWGYNAFGQLGIGSVASSLTPVEAIGLSSGVSAISAGSLYTCAVTTAGGIKCWGDNFTGQLGDGSTTSRSVPMDVSSLSSGVSSVSTGNYHTCTVTTAGGVKCWGDNFSGQLGDGSTNTSSVPVDVTGLSSGVSSVSAGGNHTCAVTTAGAVKCWGYNGVGQLGNGNTNTSSMPVDVVGLSSGVSAISTGDGYTCALMTAGGVKCWGYNFAGQLGNGNTNTSSVPVDVVGLSSGVSAISAGSYHTCALTAAGGVKCWGENDNGQLGTGSTISGIPVDVIDLSSGVSAISAGLQHSCAVTTAGAVKCWGDNFYGQLGDGSTTSRGVPVAVNGLGNGVSTISAGGSHTCAVTTAGGVKCWGDNNFGELGDGNAWRTTPVDVVDPNAATPTPTHTPTPTATPTPSLDTYEADDQCAAAKPIDPNGVFQSHNLHAAGDEDWVQFAATAGEQYRVEVQIAPNSATDVTLEVYTDCASAASDQFDAAFTPNARLAVTATVDGPLWLRLRHQDANSGGASYTYQLSVRPLVQDNKRGALILVAGRLKMVDSLQPNIHKVTQAIFQFFQENGYLADDIQYLATDPALSGVDGLPTRANLQSAITTWAASRVSADRNLTIYLIDHGDPHKFYLDQPNGEMLMPGDLNDWLSQLESAVPGVKINLIIEASYSGTFLQAAGLSRPGRVIMTSTNAGTVAYASAAGAYFSDYLLIALRQGYHLFSSYWEAQSAVQRAYVRQEPWLDGNGNGIPNEFDDAFEASQRGFALGTLGDDLWPPYIFSATPPTQIEQQRGLIQATVKDDKRVRRVWATIIAPSYIAPTSGAELTPELHPTIVLQAQGDDRYAMEYPAFDEVGRYQILIHAEDDENLEARPLLIEVQNGSRLFLPVVSR